MTDLGRRDFLGTSLGAALAFACGCEDHEERENETYDYIVVGSGAGGGPLASNLARAGYSVLVLEAGTDQGDRLVVKVPAYHPLSTEDAEMRWDFFVRHFDSPADQAEDPKATPAGVLYPRACALGGCTTHNAMIIVRPDDSDWDGIAALMGDPSFSSISMNAYWKRLERCSYATPASGGGHGFDGWLTTSTADPALASNDPPLWGAVKAAARAMEQRKGLASPDGTTELAALLTRDLNAVSDGRDQTEGLFQIPTSIDSGTRIGPRERLLATVQAGHPLTIKTGALATRVLFDAPGGAPLTAIGVEYLGESHLYAADPQVHAPTTKPKQAYVRRDVIVAAGAFNTPQLLMLSGIGPRANLEAHGIDVLIDAPGVGTNLQDRYELGVVSELPEDLAVIDGCAFDPGDTADPCLRRWTKDGSGPYGVNGTAVAAILRSSVAEDANTDLFVFGLVGDFRGYEPGWSRTLFSDHKHITFGVLLGHARNRAGTVTLVCADPRAMPEIRFHSFEEGTTQGDADARDLDALVEGVTFARSVAKNMEAAIGAVETVPGPEVEDGDDLRAYARARAWGHHASCTAAMGRDGDPMAVLDARFRVRGTENLRVVDASAFPRIPGFFIVGAIYMLSEKASDVLLDEASCKVVVDPRSACNAVTNHGADLGGGA